ncbi:DUF6230 family protein [Kitasatospora sp. NBC_01250]|uniref:DUF6230 family protein n=1 Tax=unclassified Kitasatospora TaxID=2633591 RepID=UPI002E1076CB|nr:MULTISPECIES: DUF6230 family protein [unclassified Kitasatospora]WSJ69316.1 DUF6230 family protein [Kitasatospora sp. NBC_01302]
MSQTYGKTRWKRFALVMVPSIAATAVVGVSIAQSALAASFSVSGQSFKVTTDHLRGTNFAQFGSVDAEKNGTPHVIAVSAFDHATIHNLCQSVVTDIPLLGQYTLTLHAGEAAEQNPTDDPSYDPSTDAGQVQATNLLIDLDQLNADATFTNINIGQDASTLTGSATQNWKDIRNNPKPTGAMGFAQSAPNAALHNVQQEAWATSAGTFKLPGLKLGITKGANECY